MDGFVGVELKEKLPFFEVNLEEFPDAGIPGIGVTAAMDTVAGELADFAHFELDFVGPAAHAMASVAGGNTDEEIAKFLIGF